jgi:hypothetical protein
MTEVPAWSLHKHLRVEKHPQQLQQQSNATDISNTNYFQLPEILDFQILTDDLAPTAATNRSKQ